MLFTGQKVLLAQWVIGLIVGVGDRSLLLNQCDEILRSNTGHKSYFESQFKPLQLIHIVLYWTFSLIKSVVDQQRSGQYYSPLLYTNLCCFLVIFPTYLRTIVLISQIGLAAYHSFRRARSLISINSVSNRKNLIEVQRSQRVAQIMSATHALINFPSVVNPKVDMIFLGERLF
jgi:hypothetical protein